VASTNPQEKFMREPCLTHDAGHQFLGAQQQMLVQKAKQPA
jgi:hypothetical protein